MRRSVTLAAALLTTLPLAAACSSGGVSTPASAPAPASAQPTDTSSPRNTATASTDPAGFPTDSGSATASASAEPTPALPACMIGSWVAPVSREFTNLGVKQQSEGEITGGTGMVELTFTADRRFVYTYQQVRLNLTTGKGQVNGPVSGTWTLAGNRLRTNVTGSSVSTKVTLAGIEVPSGVDDTMIRSFTPTDVMMTCTDGGLEMLMPASRGGGTVTLDKK